MKYIGYLLIVVHVFLLLWSSGGFLEMIFPIVPWKPYTNPEFPNWVLIIHWGSVLFAALSFLYGYSTKLKNTPQIMAVAYGLMAGVCIIETVGFMTSNMKYLAMAAELVIYTVILLLLYRSGYFMKYFKNK